MRDVELLARHLALKHLLPEYGGRMKPFLDSAAETFNSEWTERASAIQQDAQALDDAIAALIDIFDPTGVARKNDSYSFNRAIFDALAFYAVKPNVMKKMRAQKANVVRAYERVMKNAEFLSAIESDTAGIPNTHKRLSVWGAELAKALEMKLSVPKLIKRNDRQAIIY